MDGSKSVGVSPRKTVDLTEIVTKRQIHTTYAWTPSDMLRNQSAALPPRRPASFAGSKYMGISDVDAVVQCTI